MTLIEAARTMLADLFLPNTFWAEAVSTACYVLNRILVTKPQNKTPYELITGKIPIISYIRPFGCHVTILNTIDHLGKFEGKFDEGFLVGYSLNSKAFRVYNLETKRVEENPHINFLENKPNVAEKGPNSMFDLDYLTDSMNYQPLRSKNQANKTAGPKEANHSAGTQNNINAGNSKMEVEPAQDYFVLPIWSSYTLTVKISETKNEAKALRKEFAQDAEDLLLQAGAARATSTNTVNTASTLVSTDSPSNAFSTGGPDLNNTDQDDSQIHALEDIYDNPSDDLMNYQLVRSENEAKKTACPKKANHSAGTQNNINARNSEMEAKPAQDYFVLPIWSSYTSTVKSSEIKIEEELERLKRQEKEANDAAKALRKVFAQDTDDLLLQAGTTRATSTNTVNLASTPVSTDSPSNAFTTGRPDITNTNQDASQIPALEDIYDNLNDGIFTNASYDDEGAVADFTNLESTVNVSLIPTSRIHSIHPTTQILRDPKSAEELLQFKIQEVWILVDLPYGKKAIGTKWVYRNKKDERGVVLRNKARIEAIRIFLAFASYIGFIVYQMDVKSAFLYGIIDEEVYVSQPPGFVDPKFHKKVYKVVKALYGLHQAPRAWYATLSTFLLKSGYRRGTIDKTLFIKKDKNDIMLVQVYVDDIIFDSTKKSWCDEFEALIKNRFQMKIMKKFDFASVKTASTPIETHKSLTKVEEAADVDIHLYKSMIGSLMYLTASGLDIMFAVCACSRFQVTPKTSHLNAMRRIFRYLKGKPKLGLWYPRVSLFDLEAYSDSDYVGENLDKKSTTGEAEYVATANCCGKVLWIQNQMLDYGFNFMNIKIYIDIESTICIVKNPVFHSKIKHIEIRHHFIRDAYEKKLIQVLKIHTDDNVADLLTKAFDVSRHQELASPEQTVSGKDFSNLLIVDSLLKTIWFINAPCFYNEALAIPGQTATGKELSNPLMAGSLPKTTLPPKLLE
ncbi:putative ribonuclease H-like domain-containing protein [Tanacetum coccineum]